MKVKSLFHKVIVVLLCCLSVHCKSNKPSHSIKNNNETSAISHQPRLNIESKLLIENTSIQIENILFSPLDKICIWTFKSNGSSYEFSLTDSTWKNLEYQFGEYAFGLKESNIWQDKSDNNLMWISSFRKGLMAYSKDKNSYINFDLIKSVSSMHFLEKYVIIGTGKGIYIIDRETNKATKSETISEVFVKNIEELTGQILIINQKYKFDYITDKIVGSSNNKRLLYKDLNNIRITAINDRNILIRKGEVEEKFIFKPELIDNIIVDNDVVWMPSDYQSTKVIRFDIKNNKVKYLRANYKLGQFKVANDENRIWMYNQNMIICLNKTNFFFNYIPVNYLLNSLIADSSYIYLSSTNSIEIFDKEYLLSLSVDSNSLKTEEDDFIEMASEVTSDDDKDFQQRYESYLKVIEKYGTSTNIRIKNRLENLKEALKWLVPKDLSELDKFQYYLEEETIDKELLATIYIQVINYLNHQGELNQSIHYDSLLVLNAQEYRNVEHKRAMKEVVKQYGIISNIKAEDIAEDEQLWVIGNAYFDLFMLIGPYTGGSTYKMSYPFQYFIELLEKYPDSDYADDVEFKMLSHFEYESGDYLYNIKAIDKYKSILAKYPHTELKAEIYYQISSLYFSCESSFEEKPKYYELAKQYANKILIEFPDYKGIEGVKFLIKEIDKANSSVMWKLEITSDKQIYRPEEPIIITFKLKNIDNLEKSILVSEDSSNPNFAIRIHRSPLDNSYKSKKKIKLIRNIENYNKTLVEQKIGVGQTYSESCSIQETARSNVEGPPGKFNLNAEGVYEILAYGSEKARYSSIPSNTITIIVKK